MKAARPVRRGADGKVLRVTGVTRRRPTLHVADPSSWDEPAFVDETCHLLPAPTLQRPDLLTTVPTIPPDLDCAAALDLTDQDPTINQVMASLVLQVVRRMVAGTCPFMELYLEMEQGTVTPTYASPEAVERVVRSSSEEGEDSVLMIEAHNAATEE